MKNIFTTISLFLAVALNAAIVTKQFDYTLNSQPQNQQIIFNEWTSSLFVVDYFSNGALSFAGKNNNEFQSTICVKSIGSGNFHPLRIYNRSSVQNAGTEWRSTPIYLAQASLTFDNEFAGKGNQYLAAKVFFKGTSQTLYFWFLVNLSSDLKTFKIIKAAYQSDADTDILTESEGTNNPSTGLLNYFTNNLNIFPNPATTQATITYEGMAFNYSIYNTEGKAVLHGNGINQTVIDIAELRKGIYLIYISNKEGILSKKLIIN